MKDKRMITVFKTSYDRVGSPMLLDEFLLSNSYKNKVLKYRAIADDAERAEAKKLMPAGAISGEFSHRGKDGLLRHSGVICLDVDTKENPKLNIAELLHNVRNIDEIYYAGYSVGGKGCFLIVPIAEPDKHKQHFAALYRDFERLGVTLDKSCKDVARLRYVSYNPQPYFNPDAKTYSKLIEPMPSVPHPVNVATGRRDDVALMVAKVANSGVNITEGYDDWFALACALRGVDGGRELFHSLSAMDGRYIRAEADDTFNSVAVGGGYDDRKLFQICKRFNIYLYD